MATISSQMIMTNSGTYSIDYSFEPYDSDYWLNDYDEDEPLDETEEWLGGRCGFIPELGTCDLAGSEECDWECPLRDSFYGDG